MTPSVEYPTRENPEKAGRIYPPVAAIQYGEVSIDDWEQGKKVEFEFSVKYKMEMREGKKDIGVRVNFYRSLQGSKSNPSFPTSFYFGPSRLLMQKNNFFVEGPFDGFSHLVFSRPPPLFFPDRRGRLERVRRGVVVRGDVVVAQAQRDGRPRPDPRRQGGLGSGQDSDPIYLI